MKNTNKMSWTLHALLAAALFLLLVLPGSAQVSPEEIQNSQLRELERTHFQQLISLNHAIGAAKFPFSFIVSRYVGLDPKFQAGSDTRGIEFVNFHDRIVLKISGNYEAAFNVNRLTQNQRAGRVFHDVVLPVLEIVAREIPSDVNCDNIGFEIGYHVRSQDRTADYEGKEILVLLLAPQDAFAATNLPGDTGWQEILNRSEIYVDGQRFGLALGQKAPRQVEVAKQPGQAEPAAAGRSKTASGDSAQFDLRVPRIQRQMWPEYVRSMTEAGTPAGGQVPDPGASVGDGSPLPLAAGLATPPDVDALHAKYQTQLDALAKAGVAKFHFVDYAPPSFAIFQNRAVLQLTLRNTLHFEKESSIYKRAAQSFDLFLAPQVKGLLDVLPDAAEVNSLDVSVLNQFAPGATAATSEAIEFVCSMKSLRQFVSAEITNQQLMDQSVVLVNGVRIALNLQLVE